MTLWGISSQWREGHGSRIYGSDSS